MYSWSGSYSEHPFYEHYPPHSTQVAEGTVFRKHSVQYLLQGGPEEEVGRGPHHEGEGEQEGQADPSQQAVGSSALDR